MEIYLCIWLDFKLFLARKLLRRRRTPTPLLMTVACARAAVAASAPVAGHPYIEPWSVVSRLTRTICAGSDGAKNESSCQHLSGGSSRIRLWWRTSGTGTTGVSTMSRGTSTTRSEYNNIIICQVLVQITRINSKVPNWTADGFNINITL